MDGNYKPYDFVASSTRIKDILDQPRGQFEERDSLADRDRLTYSNGFYAFCAAVFVDIRDSAALPARYERPELAKIYRAFISEMVAVLNSEPRVREVNIVGDCVWAVYNTPLKLDIDDVFKVAYQANTLVKLLNHHYKAWDAEAIRVGIGLEYGRALMIKAGYNGSGIADVVYMGDIVNTAAHLAHEAGRAGRRPIFAGPLVYNNLNQHNQGLLSTAWVAGLGGVYAGDVIRVDMNDWIEALP